MRFYHHALCASLLYFVAPSQFGCGGDGNDADADPFDTLQACYDEHHTTEGFGVQHTITICCLDHPIGGVKPNTVCGETETACETYVRAQVLPTPEASDVTAACMDYLLQRSM